jgi:hypothetical protein
MRVNRNLNLIRLGLGIFLATIFLSVVIPTSAKKNPEDPTQLIKNASDTEISVYLPFISKSPSPTFDLTIDWLEITQAIQTASNDVPLVAGRTTVVRAFARTDQPGGTENIHVSLSAWQGGTQLPDSPLVLGPNVISPSPSRADINSSINFQLPKSWLTGQVTIEATVDSNHVLYETNENNNTSSLTLNFNSIPSLDVKIIPIHYYHHGNPNDYYPAVSQDIISNDVWNLYPVDNVNISFHSPKTFVGDLNDVDDWIYILNKITDMKQSEGAPDSQIWYGLLPVEDESGDTWFYGGVIGLGWLGDRVSIGLADYSSYGLDGGITAAHEFGHNLGREHAPCGNPAYPDPEYPYSNGIIGQFGFNLSKFTVIPNTYKDIMSYCSPEWVSDYTYIGLGNDQIAHGDSIPMGQSVQSVIVRASLDQDGQAKFEPFYEFKGQPTPPPESSEYSIEMLNDIGEIIAVHPVKVFKAEEHGIIAYSISAVVPKPQEQITTIRLLENGIAIGDKSAISNVNTLEIPNQATVVTADQVGDAAILNWGVPGIPSLVRYSSDDGVSWTTLDIDVTDGQLLLYTQSMPKGKLLFEITLADNVSSAIYYSWENK